MVGTVAPGAIVGPVPFLGSRGLGGKRLCNFEYVVCWYHCEYKVSKRGVVLGHTHGICI